MQLKEERIIGPMDTDTDGKFLESPATRENTFNNRIYRGNTEGGGGAENLLGNTLIPNSQLPSGENIVIGSAEDRKNRRVVYMVANSNADHSIFQYDMQYNDVELLAQSPLFNFSPDYPVTGIDIIDGRYCKWTDAFNQPFSIDLEKASNIRKKLKFRVYFFRQDNILVLGNNAGETNRFTDGDVFTLTFTGAQVPGSPASFSYTINTGSNALQNDFAGFCRTWATAINGSSLVSNGVITGATAFGKYVEIEMAVEDYLTATITGNTYSVLVYENTYEQPFIIDYIRRIRRPPINQIEVSDRYPATGTTFEVTGYIKGATYGWQFQMSHVFWDDTESVYNTASRCLSPTDFLFAIGNGSGAYFEDCNAPILNLQSASEFDFSNSQHLCVLDRLRVNVRQNQSVNYQRCFELNREDFVGASQFQYYIFTGEEMLLPVPVEKTIQPFDAVPIKSGTQRYIKTRLFDGDVTEGYDTTPIDVRIAPSGVNYVNATVWTASISGTSKFAGIHKKGQNKQYGIKYFDEYQRETTVLTNDNCRFRLFFPGQPGGNPTDVPEIPMSIHHDAPSWAKYWQIVQTEDLDSSDFVQAPIEIREYLDKDFVVDASPTAYTTAPYVQIKVSTIIENEFFGAKQTFPTENTRVRFMLYNSANPSAYYDVEVIRYDAPFLVIPNPSNTTIIDSIESTDAIGDIVEVYVPRQQADTEDLIFFECGPRYEVFESGGRFLHRADTDQTLTAGAVIDNIPTTYWPRFREILDQVYETYYPSFSSAYDGVWASSQWSIFEQSDNNNLSRPTTSNYNVRRIRLSSMIRWTDPYVENTEVNGLSVNKGLNYFIMPNAYGAVRSLMNDNEVLVSIHENSNSSSAYIDEASLKGSRGQEIVALSDEVVNQENPYKGNYGTQHSRGVCQSNTGQIFYLDSRSSVFIQRSSNGLEPVSRYRMTNYWRRRSQAIREANNAEVVAVYDKQFGEVIVNTKIEYLMLTKNSTNSGGDYNFLVEDNSLYLIGKYATGDEVRIRWKTQSGGNDVYYYGTGTVKSKSVPNIITLEGLSGNIVPFLSTTGRTIEFLISTAETIAYSPENNGWPTKYRFNPEDMCEIDDNFVSFLNGNIYIHNSNNVRNNFYGVQYNREIEIEFGAVAPQMSKDWLALEVQNSGAILSCPTITTSEDQESELENGNFEQIEGVAYAPFLRDKNTPGVSNAVLYGNFLKGHTIRLILRDTNTSYSLITILRAFFNPSNRTIK